MPDQEKEKATAVVPAAETAAAALLPPTAASKTVVVTEEASSQYFFGEPLVGFDPSEITGSLIVIEGMDGTVDADCPAAGMVGIGRVCGTDERLAPFESCGTRHR